MAGTVDLGNFPGELFDLLLADRLHLIFAGVHQGKENRDGENHQHCRHKVECPEDRVRNGNGRAGDLFHKILGVFGRGHHQGDGSGKAHVPADESAVGRPDQVGKVNLGNPLGHFQGQQPADDQTEPPVQPAADPGDQGHDHSAFDRGAAGAGNPRQNPVHRRSQGQGMAGDENEDHLHGKGHDPIDPVSPGLDEVVEPRFGEDQSEDPRQET